MMLEGKLALVTGAAVRLGRVLAEGLAKAGMDLALHCHSHQKEAENLAAELRSAGRRAEVFPADLENPKEAEDLAERVESRLGPVEVLILSAAVYPRMELGTLNLPTLESILNINLVSPLLLARTLGLRMKTRGHGSILTLLDWSVGRPHADYLAYHVSKAGLREATLGLARALAPEVRVNGIAPGAVLLPESTDEETRAKIQRATPLGRIGSPEDVLAAALYLLEKADFVTGTVLVVDGGRSIR